jgi:hypothetical protein
MANSRRQKNGQMLPKTSQTPSQLVLPQKNAKNLSCFIPKQAETQNSGQFLNRNSSNPNASLQILEQRPSSPYFSLPTGPLLQIFKKRISQNKTNRLLEKKHQCYLRKQSTHYRKMFDNKKLREINCQYDTMQKNCLDTSAKNHSLSIKPE